MDSPEGGIPSSNANGISSPVLLPSKAPTGLTVHRLVVHKVSNRCGFLHRLLLKKNFHLHVGLIHCRSYSLPPEFQHHLQGRLGNLNIERHLLHGCDPHCDNHSFCQRYIIHLWRGIWSHPTSKLGSLQSVDPIETLGWFGKRVPELLAAPPNWWQDILSC